MSRRVTVAATMLTLTVAATSLTLSACKAPSSSGPIRLSLTPVGRFGDLDQGLQLQNIMSITLSESGDTVYLVQWMSPFVLALSSTGDSLFTVGGGGGGPGEFGLMPEALSVSGDTLFAADRGSSSLTGFVRDRVVTRVQRRLPPLGDFQRAPYIVGRTPAGDLVFASGVSTAPVLNGQLERVPWVVVGRKDGAVHDTVLWHSLEGGFYQLTFDDGAGIIGVHPLGMPERVAMDPSGRGLVKARSVEASGGAPAVALTWYGLKGDSLAALEFSAVVASSDATRKRLVRGLAGEAHPEAAVARALDEQVEWPPLLPGVLSVFMDRSGRTWVQSPAVSTDSTRWYVVDRDRSLTGYVVLPERLKLMAALDDDVWGWLPGTYDEPIVMHFELGR